MPSRAAPIVAAACAVLVAAAPCSARNDGAAGLVVDVGPRQAVFAGAVAADATRPAARLDLVLVGRPQADVDGRTRVTASLLALAKDALPYAGFAPLPVASADRWRFIPPLPQVRIRLPMPATDDEVRRSVSRVLAAVNSGRYGEDAVGARVASVDHLFVGCDPFGTAVQSAARTRVEQLARMLGTPSSKDVVLTPLPAGYPFEAPSTVLPPCVDGSATFPDSSLPSRASYRFAQTFAFVRPMRFAVAAPASAAHDVRALAAAPTVGPLLRLRAPDVLLSVEGFADLERGPAGRDEVYEGPNGAWFPRDLTLESLDAIRRRLRAAGLPDGAIVAQLDPGDGRVYVRVHRLNAQRGAAIVAALGGSSQRERDAVWTATFGDACTDEQHALVRAVGDALARARRIAAGLGAAIDLQPVAVRTGFGSGFASCAERGREYAPTAAVSRPISGRMESHEPDDAGVLGVVAIFRIEHPDVSGAARSRDASADARSSAGRFGYVPPPIAYANAVRDGQAQLETRLHPQRIRIGLTLSPDHRHAFRAIDSGLAAGLAAKLGASAADYAAAFAPDADRVSPPAPDRMVFEAEIPNRGQATERALGEALAFAQSAGYGGFDIVPENDGCAAVDEAQALDAIRAAARNGEPSRRTGRLIAIDLRGPFAVVGRCGPNGRGIGTFAVRTIAIDDVRLGAYARVSYGR